MNYIVVIIFIISFLVVFQTYVLYPLSIFVISKFFKKKELTGNSIPISIVISAYNEEKVILQRIENLASLDYDFDKLEVLIGSDCSSDKTNEILLSSADKYSWLRVHIFAERRGKAAVINDLIKLVSNDVIVFSDANTIFDSYVLKKLIPYFEDTQIGGISGRLVLTDNEIVDNQSVEEVKYWNYETFIKRAEGRCGVLIGANGGIYAVRKELVELLPIDTPVTDDLFHSLNVLKYNFKFIYRKDALAFEEVGKNVMAEFKRKVRFSATNLQTLLYFTDLLHKRSFLTSYAFISHKILRWISPIFFILLFLTSIYLSGYFIPAYYLLIIQIVFLFLAFIGWLLNSAKIRISFFSLPFFFVTANVAISIGIINFFKKKHSYVWEKTER